VVVVLRLVVVLLDLLEAVTVDKVAVEETHLQVEQVVVVLFR
jgi:hypothetical protein